MEVTYVKILETVLIIIAFVSLRAICFKIIDKTLSNRLLQESRGLIVKRVVHIVFLCISIMLICLIWGVDQEDLGVFIGSALTVVGVAFFAQWSILSNITSSIILFFNHALKLNDSIIIMEGKDYVIEGRVVGIGLFFTTLITPESEEITLPNNVFIQKSIKKVPEGLVEDLPKPVPEEALNK
ncbi:MAG: mechanosensitive ion channel family protein [Bacteroidota bacterium]